MNREEQGDWPVIGVQRYVPSVGKLRALPTSASAVFLMGLLCANARGDGGTLRLAENAGPYRLSVFTSPTPPRAGQLDVSVLVQDAKTGAIVPDAAVSVQVSSSFRPDVVRTYSATRTAATNKLLRAAECDLAEAGARRVAVQVENQAAAEFPIEIAEPAPAWWQMSLWIGWPVLAIGLFGVHQVLAARVRRNHHGPERSDGRGD